MRAVTRRLATVLLLLPLVGPAGGCGSKISEANYYRVQHGMTEKEVEDLLGPAHAEATVPSTTQQTTTRPVSRKSKRWTRDKLTIRVEFEEGVVVSRGAEGIPAEAAPVPATRATGN